MLLDWDNQVFWGRNPVLADDSRMGQRTELPSKGWGWPRRDSLMTWKGKIYLSCLFMLKKSFHVFRIIGTWFMLRAFHNAETERIGLKGNRAALFHLDCQNLRPVLSDWVSTAEHYGWCLQRQQEASLLHRNWKSCIKSQLERLNPRQ